MKVTKCDRCGGEITRGSVTVTLHSLSTGHEPGIRKEYDLCRPCCKLVLELITGDINE